MHCTGHYPDSPPTHSPQLTPSIVGNITVRCGRRNVTDQTTTLRVGRPGWVAVALEDADGHRGVCDDEHCVFGGSQQHIAVEYLTGSVRLILNDPDRYPESVLRHFEATGIEVPRPAADLDVVWPADPTGVA